MGKRDPRVDRYIASAPEFAQPILTSLRDTMHAACPDVEEALKWGHPAFMYHGILAGMAAFKQHCTFGFWKSSLIGADSEKIRGSMGQFGRITSTRELPARKVITGYVKTAMKLNEDGVKPPRTRTAPKAAIASPKEFTAALARNKAARATFDAFPPGQQREYLEWITEAKRDETRERRIAQAVEWLAEGKRRNWKYEQ